MSNTPSVADAELAKIIGSEPARGRFRVLRWLVALAVLAGLAAGGFLWFRSGPDANAAPQYQTEPLSRGNLRVTVSATGKLAPVNQVDVGSELSGTIEAVLVDDNDRLSKGQVLARLDIAKLRDQSAKSRAALASAEAKVLQTVATVKETRANLGRLRQVAKLSGGKVPAPTELETAEAMVDRAVADEAGARAAVEEARATLRSNETDLTKASIRSPIDGVVLQRKVEPGQTVAASLQAPVLFTLAENLAQMELQVDVDEADVGQVQRWAVGHVHRGRLSQPELSRPHQSGAVRGGDGEQRGDLQDHSQRGQRRSQPAARHDRDGGNRHHRTGKRAAGPERGAALHTATTARSPVQRRRRTGGQPAAPSSPESGAQATIRERQGRQERGAADLDIARRSAGRRVGDRRQQRWPHDRGDGRGIGAGLAGHYRQFGRQRHEHCLYPSPRPSPTRGEGVL